MVLKPYKKVKLVSEKLKNTNHKIILKGTTQHFWKSVQNKQQTQKQIQAMTTPTNNQIENKWDIMFNRVSKHLESNERYPHKHSNVKEEKEMGEWVMAQHKWNVTKQISGEHSKMLESLPNWEWDTLIESFPLCPTCGSRPRWNDPEVSKRYDEIDLLEAVTKGDIEVVDCIICQIEDHPQNYQWMYSGLEKAIKTHRLEIVKKIFRVIGTSYLDEMFDGAVKFGDYEIAKTIVLEMYNRKDAKNMKNNYKFFHSLIVN